MCHTAQGLRVYEQHGRLLASFQDQLSDAVQGQLQALFQSLVSSFLAAAKIKVSGMLLAQQDQQQNLHCRQQCTDPRRTLVVAQLRLRGCTGFASVAKAVFAVQMCCPAGCKRNKQQQQQRIQPAAIWR